MVGLRYLIRFNIVLTILLGLVSCLEDKGEDLLATVEKGELNCISSCRISSYVAER